MAKTSGQSSSVLWAVGGLAAAVLISGAAPPATAGCKALTGFKTTLLATRTAVQVPPLGTSLYGHVYTVDGKPVAGATVRTVMLSAKGKTATGKTDAAGRYALKGLNASAIGVVVEHPKYGKIGPLPARLFEGFRDHEEAQALKFDIGGLGDGAVQLTKEQKGKPLYVRTVKLASKVRRFAADGRGGMLALTTDGVRRVSPAQSEMPIVRINPPATARTAGAAPAATRVSGPGAPASDLFVGTAYGNFGNSGNLSRFRPDGRKTWCLELPVKPAELEVAVDGTTWMIGTSPEQDLAVRVTPGGRPSNVYRLANGNTYDLAVDKAGNAWFINGTEGLVRLTADGKISKRVTLPAPAKSLFSTPDGGVWAVGGGVATRFDKNGRGMTRVVRQEPALLISVDGEGRLWMFDEKVFYAVEGRTITKHPLEGKTLPQTLSMSSDGGRHVWLLGPDRMTAAIVDLPCDCGH